MEIFSAVIPARTLSEITRILDKDDKEINVYIQNNTLFVEEENTIIFSRLIEGEYVKYNHILPTNFEIVVTVNKNSLLNSIERASLVARNDRYNVIKFDIKEDIMTVSSKSEVGNVNENVNINLKGKDLTIAFNGKYIMDFLKITEEDFINLNLNSAIDPCVMSSMKDDGLIYLILPVRISA